MRRPGPLLLALTLPAAALTVLALPAQAHADDGPTASCTITDAGPHTIVIGSTPQSVQFHVDSTCTDAAGQSIGPVKWSVQAENIMYSPHVSWLAVCTYAYAGPSVVDCAHDGATTMDLVRTGDGQFTGNDMAGTTHPLGAFAFADLDGDNRFDGVEPRAYTPFWFTLERATCFGDSIRISHQQRRAGQKVTLRARLTRADWIKGHDVALDDTVTLQLRPAGQIDWQDLDPVQTQHGRARVRIAATVSGDYRFRFAGTDTDAGSTSDPVSLTVT